MALDQLRALVAPPVTPVAAGTTESWGEVERRLGTVLPSDYKGLVNTYGAGWFSKIIEVPSPFHSDYGLFDLHRTFFNRYDIRLTDYPERSPGFLPFPEPGGVLPCAQDEGGGVILWRTEGAPDDWGLVLMDTYLDNQFYIFNMPLTSFLAGFIKGEILVPSLSNDEESSNIPVFEPYQSA